MHKDTLTAVWVRHLGDASEHRGFLDLGGHSLMAVRLAADIRREAGVTVPVSHLLRGNPTLDDIRRTAAFDPATAAPVARAVRRRRPVYSSWSPPNVPSGRTNNSEPIATPTPSSVHWPSRNAWMSKGSPREFGGS
ncbi:MAG TPA: acyl carrier protein [Candidatus Stackebrandtia excrementipullorum]|nr:acyl carrier protein [Candidatus Stackebrandtia excrementipullorum]